MLKNLWLKFQRRVATNAGLTEYRDHHFYPHFLGDQSFSLDLGSHKGEFARYLSQTFGCEIIGLEANPVLHGNLPNLPKTRFLNLAVSDTNSPIEFHISDNPEASSIYEDRAVDAGKAQKVSIEGVTLDKLIKDTGANRVHLVKIDIESAEFPLFETVSETTLSNIDQLTVEFHPIPGSEIYSISRIMKICDRMKEFGFTPLVMNRQFTDVLFLNLNHLKIPLHHRFHLLIYQYFVMPIRMILNSASGTR